MRSRNSARSLKATILIIDNDPLMLTLVAALLHNVGHECHCAKTSEAALKAARSLPLDLIIADLDLAGENGLDLVMDMKREPGMADVPFMVVSGSQIPDVVQRVREQGGTYYLRKPFDPEVLLELVDKSLWMPHLVNAQVVNAQIVHGPASGRIPGPVGLSESPATAGGTLPTAAL